MNVEVIGRIRPVISQDSDSGISENRIAIEIEGHNRLKNKLTGAGFAFSCLHKSTATSIDVYETSVEPMMQLFLTGFNCCLLIIGEEGAGKSFTSSGQNGIAYLIMKQLLTKFEEDLEQSHSKSFPNNTRLLSLQIFEVTDDSIKDLLSSGPSATSRRLEVTYSAESGPSVSNLSSLQILNGVDAQLRFKQSLANRNRKAASFVCFDLSQPMQDTSPPTRSQLSIVVLPAIQPSSAPSSVRVSQFSASEKSMLAFSQLVATLSNQPFADRTINYSACSLTKLLEDALGGNCKTTALLCFRPLSDPNIDTSLLHLAEGLAKVKNYPVINNTFLQQLLTQYRSRIISLEALLNPAIRNVVNSTTGDTTLRDLQAENVLLRDSNERLQHKLEHLKTSFGSLAVSKTDLSAQLLLTEEEKLKISQTLLDMQIENNRLKEEMEAAKFELNNHIIQLEYSKGELARDKEKATRLAQSAQERLGDVEKEHRDLADDYIRLKSEFMALTKAHHAEIDKNDELSLELMNIVNSKISLMEANQMNPTSDRLRAIADHLSKKPERFSPSKTELDSWQKKEKPISRGSPKRQIEIDKMKKDYEEIEKELRKKIQEQAQELDNSRKMTRETQKKLAEMNAQVITLKNGKLHFESQVNRLQHKLKESNEEFQMRLITYLKDVAEALKQGEEKEKNIGLTQQVNAMLNDLRKAHRMREDQLSDAALNFKRQMEQTNRRHEELLVAYMELRQQVKSRGLSGVDLGPDERSLTMDDNELKSRQQREIERLQEKLATFNKARLHQDDSASDISDNDNSFDGDGDDDDGLPALKKQLREFTLNTQQELEEERAELLSKNAMLEQEVEELHDYINTHLTRYRDEIVRLRQEGAKTSAPGGEKRSEGGFRRRRSPPPPLPPSQAAAQNRRPSVRRP